MVLLWNNVVLLRADHAVSVVYHYECLTSRNAYDYLHNFTTQKSCAQAGGGSFSRVFAKQGYKAPRCQNTSENINPLPSAETHNLQIDRFTGFELGMLTMAYPRFPAYEGNYFINIFLISHKYSASMVIHCRTEKYVSGPKIPNKRQLEPREKNSFSLDLCLGLDTIYSVLTGLSSHE